MTVSGSDTVFPHGGCQSPVSVVIPSSTSLLSTPPSPPQCSSFVVSSVVNTSCGRIGFSFPGPGPHLLTPLCLNLSLSLLHLNTHIQSKAMGPLLHTGRWADCPNQRQHKNPHYVHNFQCMFT